MNLTGMLFNESTSTSYLDTWNNCYNDSVEDVGDKNTRNCSTDTETESFQPTISSFHFLFIFMDLVTTIGCVVVAVLIYKATKLKDTPGKLLFNHTIADGYMGFSFLVMNFLVLTVTDKSLLQKLHLAHRILLSVTGCESMHTLAMILFTLHLAICNPITYKLHCRTVYVLVYLILSWSLNGLFNSSVLLVGELNHSESSSMIIWLYLKDDYLLFGGLSMLIAHILPMVVITACYIRISLHVKGSVNTEIYNQSASKAYIKQAKGIMLMSITYFLTQVPVYAFEILSRAFATSENAGYYIYLISLFTVISYLYMVLKLPLILYGFRSYRRVFLEMFCCCRRSATRQTRNPVIQCGREAIDLGQNTNLGESQHTLNKETSLKSVQLENTETSGAD